MAGESHLRENTLESSLQCPQAFLAAFFLDGRCRLEQKVEVDVCVAAVGVFGEANFGDQFVARGVGKIIVQVLVACQVDLRGEMTMTGAEMKK